MMRIINRIHPIKIWVRILAMYPAQQNCAIQYIFSTWPFQSGGKFLLVLNLFGEGFNVVVAADRCSSSNAPAFNSRLSKFPSNLTSPPFNPFSLTPYPADFFGQLEIKFQHSPLISTAGLSVIPRHFLKNSKLFCPNGLVRISANCS